MHLNRVQTLFEAKDRIFAVRAVRFSPDDSKIAVITADRVVHIFDANSYEKTDKFSTKAASKDKEDPEAMAYLVNGMAFAPDSSRLGVAQSDNIVFVYKFGHKMSICNKFPVDSSVNVLVWPPGNDVFFGTYSGKLMLGKTKSNNSVELFSASSSITSIAFCYEDSSRFGISGHADGSICKFFYIKGRATKFFKLVTFPKRVSSLACLHDDVVAVAGSNILRLFEKDGENFESFDFDKDTKVKGIFTVMAVGQKGQSFAVGNFNCVLLFSLDRSSGKYALQETKYVKNYYTIRSLGWKHDGTKLIVGTLCGCVDIFEICVKKQRYKNLYEIIYLSPANIVFVRLSDGHKLTLETTTGLDIGNIRLHCEGQFLTCSTGKSLMAAVFDSSLTSTRMGLSSEIRWDPTGKEIFLFDGDTTWMFACFGEVMIVKFGENVVLATCRTDWATLSLISIRLDERPSLSPSQSNQKVAYLTNPTTVVIQLLDKTYIEKTIAHGAKIDWIELNSRGDFLLIRDKKRRLHLYSIIPGEARAATTLLQPECGYAQWVPRSDSIVAQKLLTKEISIWYSARNPSNISVKHTSGEVMDIIRRASETVLHIREHTNSYSEIALDAQLINFETCLEDGDLVAAISVLKLLTNQENEENTKYYVPELGSKLSSMWMQLAQTAFDSQDYFIAQECYAALVDISKVLFLKRITKAILVLTKTGLSYMDSLEHWKVKSLVHRFSGNFSLAEKEYFSPATTAAVNEVIKMYDDMEMFEESIRASERGVRMNLLKPDVPKQLRTKFEEYCSSSKQFARLGHFLESDNKGNSAEYNFERAVELYLDAQQPTCAIQAIQSRLHGSSTYKISVNSNLISRVAKALKDSKFYNKAGEAYILIGDHSDAFECFLCAKNFSKGLDIAREKFPEKVVSIEEAWGDQLLLDGYSSLAIEHFVEAGKSKKAVAAAIAAKKFGKATEMIKSMGLETFDKEAAQNFYCQLAEVDQKNAETYFLRAGEPSKCVKFYLEAGQWQEAHKIATKNLSVSDMKELYIKRAEYLAGKQKFLEAEKILLLIDEYDEAIRMYKLANRYDDMLRLVSAFKKDYLNTALINVGQSFEAKEKWRSAEKYYIRARDFLKVINMYVKVAELDVKHAITSFGHAIRVAKSHAGTEEGLKHEAARLCLMYLRKHGSAEPGHRFTAINHFRLEKEVVAYLVEAQKFDEAFEIISQCCKGTDADTLNKEVEYNLALYYEDEGKLEQAENSFIKARKPKEAIEMYLHQKDYRNASRIAESHCPNELVTILLSQAENEEASGNYSVAEAIYLKVHRPELVLAMYENSTQWEKAICFAEEYFPQRVKDLFLKRELCVSIPDGVKILPKAAESSESKQVSEAEHSDNVKYAHDILHQAQFHLDNNTGSKALELFMQLTPAIHRQCNESLQAEIEQGWSCCFRLVKKQFRHKIDQIIPKLAHWYQEVACFAKAAEVLRYLERYDEAAMCYSKAADYENALKICQSQMVREEIEASYKDHLHTEKDITQLNAVGEHAAAVELLFEQERYTEAFEMVRSNMLHSASHYVFQYLDIVLQQNVRKHAFLASREWNFVFELIEEFCFKQTFELSKVGQVLGNLLALAPLLLGQTKRDIDAMKGGKEAYISWLKSYRSIMSKFFVNENLHQENRHLETDIAEKIIMCSHIYINLLIAERENALEMKYLLAVFLLYFTDSAVVFPLDKGFALAGRASKDYGEEHISFTFFNMLLDIYEFSLDGTVGENFDNSDIIRTDIPPVNERSLRALTEPEFYLCSEERETLREQVLDQAMQTDNSAGKQTMDKSWSNYIKHEIKMQLGSFIRKYDRENFDLHEEIQQQRKSFGI